MWAGMNRYVGRWEVAESSDMVGDTEVDGDSFCRYVKNLFGSSSW